MPVEINDILHVLAHELRTPVGIAHGYVRLLLEDRLPQETDRRRALEQMQKALGRLSELSQESTALAAWYEQDRTIPQHVDARTLVERIAAADYEFPVIVESSAIPAGVTVRSFDADALGQAMVSVVRATARELRGAPCDVLSRIVEGRFEMLAGQEEHLAALRSGPMAPGASPLALERGGLGLALVHAVIVLDAHGAERWTVNGSRQTAGIRILLEERPYP